MTTYEIEDIKGFMHKLLKTELFDRFEVRGVTLVTFTTIELSGIVNRQNLSEDERQNAPHYCYWRQIKPVLYHMIRGGEPPDTLKIIFSVAQSGLTQIHENASALYLNIHYEQKKLSVISGTSPKKFSLDKSLDARWDQTVYEFLTKNAMNVQMPL